MVGLLVVAPREENRISVVENLISIYHVQKMMELLVAVILYASRYCD